MRTETRERMKVLAKALSNRERLVRRVTQEAEVAKARLLFHQEQADEEIQRLKSALEHEIARAAVLTETLSSTRSRDEEKEGTDIIFSLHTELEGLRRERAQWILDRRASMESAKRQKDVAAKEIAVQCLPVAMAGVAVQTEMESGGGEEKEQTREREAAAATAAAVERERMLLGRIQDLEDM